MPTTIDLVAGVGPSKPARIMKATADFTAITSYATGGHALAVLTAELVKVGEDAYSVPMAAHNGSATRYFQVDLATGKLKAYTTISLEVEVTAAVDLSGYTAIPVLVIGA